MAVLLVQLVVVGGTALAMGWRPSRPASRWRCSCCWSGPPPSPPWGCGSPARSAPEATLAITNLVWVLLAAVGGILIPGTRLPGAMQSVVDLLPSAALGDALRAALIEGRLNGAALVILLVWAILAGFAATRWFKWN